MKPLISSSSKMAITPFGVIGTLGLLKQGQVSSRVTAFSCKVYPTVYKTVEQLLFTFVLTIDMNK